MIRISKLTDYALIILTEMQENQLMSATLISKNTHIPLATTNKVLKLLLHKNICQSKNGKTGGFILSKTKNTISLLDVVHAIEGNTTSLTQCNSVEKECSLNNTCKIKHKMNLIDKEINQILSNKYLSDLS